MASKTFIRTLLVAVLVVTAHTIKPFSFGNVTMHALSTARSFAFVMPETAVERIEYANYVAQTFGKRLFEDGDSSVWTSEDVLRSGLVAFASPAAPFDDAEIKDVKSPEPARKIAPKRAVRRIKRDESQDNISGCTESDSLAKLPPVPAYKAVAMLQPMDLPVYQQRVSKVSYLPTISRAALVDLKSKLEDCSKTEVKAGMLIALIRQTPPLRVELVVMPRKTTIISQCQDADVKEVETAETIIENTIGPEEEEFFFEPAPPAPFSAPAPLTAPNMEECIRIL